MTVNRYCASGSGNHCNSNGKNSIGMADCIIAGGAESMSYIPMGGYKPVPNYELAKEGHEDYYWGMGLTAEAVAKKYKVPGKPRMNLPIILIKRRLKAQKKIVFRTR